MIQVGDKGLVLEKVDGPNHLKVVEEFGYELDTALRSHPQGHSGLPEPGIPGLLHQTGLRPSGGVSADQPERPSGRASRNPETGLSVSHGEYVHDAIGIGAPVFGINGSVTASVGIIAPTAGLPTRCIWST